MTTTDRYIIEPLEPSPFDGDDTSRLFIVRDTTKPRPFYPRTLNGVVLDDFADTEANLRAALNRALAAS